MAAEAIDTSTRIETPENIAFEFRVAGPWRRAWAYVIDFVIRCMAILIAVFLLSITSAVLSPLEDLAAAPWSLLLLGYFVLEWFYCVLFEWRWQGRTPGKRALGLRVVKEGGYAIGLQDALLRNLLRAADLMPPLLPLGVPIPSYLFGVLVSGSDLRFRRLGDMVAGTVVIAEEPAQLRRPAVVQPPLSSDEKGIVPPHPRLSVEEKKTLDAFMRRFGAIHPARREELCGDYALALAKRLGAPPPRSGARFLQLVYSRLTEAGPPNRRRAL